MMLAEIPVGTTAEVTVPKLGLDDVKIVDGWHPVWENGKLMPRPGVHGGAESDDSVVLELGSGRYLLKTTEGGAEDE